MNYYQASEIQKDGKGTGKFRYTKHNKRTGTYAVGYCADDCEGHDTEEEACEHYRQYLLNERVRTGTVLGSKHQCSYEGCEEWTQNMAHIGEASYSICQFHNNREDIEKIFPKVGRSFGSH